MTEIISLVMQLIPFAIKEYEVLKEKGDFTPEQRAKLDAQIQSFRDFAAQPQWDPRES